MPVLANVVVFAGFRIGMIIALCHISGLCLVQIEDVSEIVSLLR